MLFDRRDIRVADLKEQQFVRRAYAAPDRLPPGVKTTSTAVADLMEAVAAFVLSGRFVGFLPAHFAAHWVAQDLMRPLLEAAVGYPNPVYLATRKAETTKPVLSVFLKELRQAHAMRKPGVFKRVTVPA